MKTELVMTMALGAAIVAAAGTGVRRPVVGTAIATGMDYHDTATFKSRPVCAEFEQAGLDMDYLEKLGKVKGDWVRHFKRYNVLWIMIEHEGFEKSVDPDKLGETLRSYVEQGGGLVLQHSPGRYPEAPTDPYWNTVCSHLDMTRLHEEIVDVTTATNYGQRMVFYADKVKPHPVTEGVPGLWLVARQDLKTGYGGTWGSHAIVYPDVWQVVVETGPGGKSYKKHPRTNVLDYNAVGRYTAGAPIVAVRTLGKGRVVSIAVHKDTCAWMYGIDTWYNPTEHGDFAGRPSEGVRLVRNALKWAAEPSLAIAGFAADYKPHLNPPPPYKEAFCFGRLPGTVDKATCRAQSDPWKTFGCWNPDGKRVTGVIGLHSSHSDGASSVAEYAAEAKRLGLSFIVFTDPLAKLTSEKLELLRADCAAASDETFYACPGIEYSDISGLDWILYHDKIAWPKEAITLDGRTYQVFKDGKITQRNNFGGHQNLYRGAVVNAREFEAKGINGVNLAYFNAAVPRAYDGAKLIHDNTREMLSVAHDLFRYGPVSYTRCRSAADLKTCAETSVLVCDTLEGARNLCNRPGGWGGWDASHATRAYVRCGGDIAVNDWRMSLLHGVELVRLAYDVSSADGIDEVTVCDGARRVLARIDGKGGKRVKGETVFSLDTQSVPQLVVRDRAGHVAYSGNEWAYYYHAGLHRCGDNSNLQGVRPRQLWFPNWDDCTTPVQRERYETSAHPRWIGEACEWGVKVPSRLPSMSFRGTGSEIALKGVDWPGKNHRPSSKTVFALMNPVFGAIVDQYFGDYRVGSTHSDIRSTYANTSVPCRDGESPYWRHHRRTYLLQDRRDDDWAKVTRQQPDAYLGGVSVVEGEIRFVADATLAAPYAAIWHNVSMPGGEPLVQSRGDFRAMGAGDYVSLVADPVRRYAFVVLPGSDPLVADVWGKGADRHVKLSVGAKDRAYKAGDVLKYRFAVLHLRNAGTNPYAIASAAARLASVGGIETLAAKDGAATKTVAAGDSFIEDLSIAVKGLQDNGCAYAAYPDGRLIPMGFLDGVAYTAVPAELAGEYRFLNLFTCDDPALRFTFIPKMKGHDKAELLVYNLSDKSVTTTVRDVRGGTAFEVTVPARDAITRELVQR